jgi:hypothetical protein
MVAVGVTFFATSLITGSFFLTGVFFGWAFAVTFTVLVFDVFRASFLTATFFGFGRARFLPPRVVFVEERGITNSIHFSFFDCQRFFTVGNKKARRGAPGRI